MALATQIREFIEKGTLDTRCAAKLIERLKKEAESIAESSKATKPGQQRLSEALVQMAM